MRPFRLDFVAVLLPVLLLAASNAHADDIERGRKLARNYACDVCHRMPGASSRPSAELGPPLDRFGARSYIAGRLPNRPDVLARWIADPPALVPDTVMPNLGISDEEARAIAAWLSSLS